MTQMEANRIILDPGPPQCLPDIARGSRALPLAHPLPRPMDTNGTSSSGYFEATSPRNAFCCPVIQTVPYLPFMEDYANTTTTLD